MGAVALLVIALMGASPATLHAPDTNAQGTRGVWTLDAARPLPVRTLALTLSGSINSATHVFAPPDSYHFEQGSLQVLWAPAEGWDLVLRGRLAAATYKSYYTHNLQQLGNLGAHVKYTAPPLIVDIPLDVGFSLDLTVPDAVQSASPVFPASRFEARAIATYEPMPWLNLTANLGVVVNGIQSLTHAVLPPDEAIFRGLGAPRYSGTLGLGAAFYVDHLPGVKLNPGLEVTGELGADVPMQHNLTMATLVLRASPKAADFLHLGVGATARLSGVQNGVGVATQTSPWNAFALVSFHLFEHAGEGCHADTDCPAGATCAAGVCVLQVEKEVIKTEKEITITIAGEVVDAASGAPIADAVVLISGFESTPLSVNRQTGAFTSFPIPVSPEPLTVVARAPGYSSGTVSVARNQPDLHTHVVARLQRVAGFGRLSGSFRDAVTGQPIKGEVHMLATQNRIVSHDDGTFSGPIPTGHVDVVFSATGYKTQKASFTVEDDDSIVVDVDMRRAGNTKPAGTVR